MRIYKNIHLIRSSATGGLKPSRIAEICRKGQRVGTTITFDKSVITLTEGKRGDFLIKEVFP